MVIRCREGGGCGWIRMVVQTSGTGNTGTTPPAYPQTTTHPLSIQHRQLVGCFRSVPGLFSHPECNASMLVSFFSRIPGIHATVVQRSTQFVQRPRNRIRTIGFESAVVGTQERMSLEFIYENYYKAVI